MHSEQNRNIETLTHEETLSNQVFALTMTLNYSFYSLRNSLEICIMHEGEKKKKVHGIPASFFFLQGDITPEFITYRGETYCCIMSPFLPWCL